MPQYLQVVIQKTNMDTMQAVHYVAKKIKKASQVNLDKAFGCVRPLTMLEESLKDI